MTCFENNEQRRFGIAMDLNTKFFHATSTIRRKMNRVGHLEDEDGVVCWSEDGIRHIVRDYFT
jgi:hypothetical protein